jgi:single-strand DNA-binding protein
MSANNHGTLVGRLATDPETGHGATTMARFRFAVDGYDFSAKAKKTDFFTVVAFGKVAERVIKYLHKGDGAILDYSLNQRQYETKAGDKRDEPGIVLNDYGFPPSNKGATAPSHAPTLGYEADEPEDPFSFS